VNNPIFFWTDKEFKCFSNFYSSILNIDGQEWKTVEHYFQAMKSLDPIQRDEIRLSLTPKIAKALGQKCNIRKDWQEIKYDVMLKALRTKFCDENLRKILLSSVDRDIYEDSPTDKEWGTGELNGVGTGNNKLGKALMQVRKEIKTWLGESNGV